MTHIWNALLNSKRLRKSSRSSNIDPRNPFESDLGRVIFSPAVRRMHDKTQVFPLTTNDNIHSRLTHSLEVMTIGYSLGLRLIKEDEFLKKSQLTEIETLRSIPIILKTICVAHDIGNPPFGHFGEEIIQNYFKKLFKKNKYGLKPTQRTDFTSFDGNAQGFRVLTKLQVLNDCYGLNLSYATLASYLKYPNPNEIDKSKVNLKKRGVFRSEANYLKKIAKGCGLINKDNVVIRHPLSFLMEAADSICYYIMDIEDGFNKGWFSFDEIYSQLKKYKSIESILKKAKDKENNSHKMVTLRIELISYLVDLAIKNFITNYELIYSGEYHKELIFDDPNGIAKFLDKFNFEKVYPNREITSLELTGNSVLVGLLDYYINFIFHENKHYKKRALGLISSSLKKAALLENNISNFDDLNNYSKFRIIVDYISGMTDQYALNHYQKLSGQKII